jgi:hypothetical protein
VAGDFIYYTEGADGLQIYQLDDANGAVARGRFDTAGSARDVQVVDEVAFVADGSGGLQMIGVTNPDAPMVLGGVPIAAAEYVAVFDNRAYVLASSVSSPMMHIVDVSDPASASIVGSVPIVGGARTVAVHNERAYVGSSDNGIDVFDVGNPEEPEFLQRVLRDPGRYSGFHIFDGYLIGGARSGLVVMDLVDPDRPSIVGSVPLAGDSGRGMDLREARAYVGLSRGTGVVDVSNPRQPTYLGTLARAQIGWDVAVGPDVVVVSTVREGFATSAPVIPLPPSLGPEVRIQGRVQALQARGGKGYVGTQFPNELWVIDGSDPANPRKEGGVVMPQAFGPIALRDELLFAAGRGMHVVDVSDSSAPAVLGGEDELFSGFAASLVANGDYLYAGLSNAIQLVDVSTPAAPTLGGAFATASTPECLLLDGVALLSCERFSGMRVSDVTQPDVPVLGNLLLDSVEGMDAGLSTAYVGHLVDTGRDELRMVDYSNVAAPAIGTAVTLPSAPRAVAVNDDYAYVSINGGAQVQVIDVSDPGLPFLAAELPTRFEASLLAASEDAIFVGLGAFGQHGLQVFSAPVREVP